MLTKDDIREAQDIETDTVEVPEWGGTVTVRGLSAVERGKLDNFGAAARRGEADMSDLHVQTIILGTVNEDGEPFFDDDDAEWLRDKSGAAVSRISERIWDMSGISEEDVEDAVKNSETTENGSSGTS